MVDTPQSRVLVVDDNAENRALAKATLEDDGYEVELATTGAQAIATFTSMAFDCVLLDIRMPGIDGIEVCTRLRALPGGVDVPIVFLTAQRDVDTFDRARAVGGDDYITKPYRPDELLVRVAAAAKLRRIAVERSELFELVRKQRDDLVRLQLQKDQLIAFLVHDLKNPVNSIELNGQRIVRDTTASARTRDAATKIQDETRSLLGMIMNLLDLSKADEGRLIPSLARVPLAELFGEVVETMQPRALAARVTVARQPTGTTITADRDLVTRMLTNLVDNAIRYAPEDSAIQLLASDTGTHVEIRVADTGVGVPEVDRERVFERFQSGAEVVRSSRGLGLAFCKLAVEAHGGRIWIEDAFPGAVFCVRIPHG